MNKIIIVLLCFFVSNISLAQERKKIPKKYVKKEAKKEAKRYAKEGYVLYQDSLSMESRLYECNNLQDRLDKEGDPEYMVSNGSHSSFDSIRAYYIAYDFAVARLLDYYFYSVSFLIEDGYNDSIFTKSDTLELFTLYRSDRSDGKDFVGNEIFEYEILDDSSKIINYKGEKHTLDEHRRLWSEINQQQYKTIFNPYNWVDTSNFKIFFCSYRKRDKTLNEYNQQNQFEFQILLGSKIYEESSKENLFSLMKKYLAN